MDVHDTRGEIVRYRHELEEAGHDDQIDLGAANRLEHRATVSLVRVESLALEHDARHISPRRVLQAASLRGA